MPSTQFYYLTGPMFLGKEPTKKADNFWPCPILTSGTLDKYLNMKPSVWQRLAALWESNKSRMICLFLLVSTATDEEGASAACKTNIILLQLDFWYSLISITSACLFTLGYHRAKFIQLILHFKPSNPCRNFSEVTILIRCFIIVLSMLVKKEKRFLLSIDASWQNRILVTGKNIIIFTFVSSGITYVCVLLDRLLELIC